MTEDQYNLKDKSDNELSEWLRKQTPGTNEHIAGEKEILRRVAVIEELIEREEAPSRKREWIAIGIAALTLVVTMIAITLSY
jgi:hypothetical protein